MEYSKWKYINSLKELRLYKANGEYWTIKMDNSEQAKYFLKFLRVWINNQLEF